MKPGQAKAPGGGRRRALVVGVGRTPALERDEHLARRFPALQSAVEDVELVSRALRQSHYEVRPLHDPGGFELLGALQEFFDECSPGDTAFLYMSCHGTTVGKRDHLLPADVQPGRMDPAGGRSLLDRTLIAADPGGLLDGLPAGVTTVVCLDICRTEEPTPLAEQGRNTVLSAAEDVYWLYSCGRGERSYADPQEGSWFGRALAKALAPTTQPTTFADLVRDTRTAVRRNASDAGVMPPTVDRYVPHGLDPDDPGPVLCEGAQEAYRWTTMIEQSCLWRYTSGTAAVHERVKKRLGELVEHIVDSLSTEGAHRDDPWTDPTYPVRVVDRLETLVKRARLEGRDLLSPAETAALLAAPVVQEGIVAIALEELRRTMPEGMDVKSADDALEGHDRLVRDAAHDVARAHSQVRRTVATLRRRGLKEQTAAADHWLRHRFITDWDPLWERTGDYSAVDTILDLLVGAILDAAADPTGAPVREATRLTIDGQVRQVLGHLTVHPSTSPRINDARGGDDWSTYPPVPGNQWRASDLARLLWTAGLQAADPRRMSSVLVDHLGAHEPLDPDDVVAALSADFGYDVTLLGEQDEGPYELTVRFACPHPALHVAVEELAARTNATVDLLHQECQKARTTPPALLRGFPERVTTDQLVPVAERYKQPLERFRLAEDEIRPLLMGTQLYGDPMLAVRELYQNALDACRYRDMRRQYGAAQGRPGPDWQPRITFTQGWDADGRPYIECTDNGSGMNRAKLTSMFARAGKRYEQDPEFVQERRNWRRADLGEMPLNSRFGIGVFSYFMLAEEVVVWTSPVDHYGRALQLEPLRADIQSGSGLLRIGEDPHVALDGGTRVRLYLGEDATVAPSLVETLESFLWVADFEVEARELTKDDNRTAVRHRRWEPGALTPPTPKPWYGDAVQGTRDIWLVQGKGGWLLDGVVIKDAPESCGHIVNLRERHRPEPSVDRNSLISYDEEAVTSELLDAAPRATSRWREVLLPWLWELAGKSPRLAFTVLDSLPDGTAAIIFPPGAHPDQTLPRTAPLATVGCLPMDESAGNSRGPWRGQLGDYQSALAGQWQKTRLALHQGGKAFLPPGYPRPTAMDAILFPKEANTPRGWQTVLRAAYLTHMPSAEPLKALRRYAILGMEVPAATDIRRLRTARPTRELVELSGMWRSMLREGHWNKPALYAPLLLIAARHRLPLADAVALLEELRAWQPELPPPPVLDADLAAEVPTRGDAALLVSQELDEELHVWPGELGVVDLLVRGESGVPVSDLAARVRRFEPLGFSLREDLSPAAIEHGPLNAMERSLFVRSVGGRLDVTRRRGDDLRIDDLLVLAAELQIPPSEAASRLNALTPVTGIRADEPPAEVADWIPSSLAAEVLTTIRRRGAGVSPWEFIRVITRRASRTPTLSPRSEIDLDEIDKVLRRLNSAGLLAPGFEDRIEETLRQLEVWDHPLTRGHSVALSGRNLDEQGVTPAVLVQLSATERRPIGDIVRRLTGQDQVLPVSVSRPDPAVLDLQATSQDVGALLTQPSGRFLPALRLSRLLRHAYITRRTLAASIEHLTRFQPLGGPPPPCAADTPGAAAVRDHTPDLFDMAAFGPGLLGIDDETCVLGPLELVRTAGRFDWTLGRTYDRYAPFACLGLDVTVGRPEGEVADRVPDWQDLIILTEQLTGRAPALAGTVSEDHITLSAEETDLPESQVRERLARYAALFCLELPCEAPHPEGTAE